MITVDLPAIIHGGAEGPRAGRANMVGKRGKRISAVIRDRQEWSTLAALIGNNIRAARLKRDVAVAELAAALGSEHAGYIQRCERGIEVPSMTALLGISLALDVPIGELVPVDVRNVRVFRRSAVAVREEQQAALVAAMKRADGIVQHAAKLLGWHRTVVVGRLRRFGLSHLRRKAR